MQSTFSHHCNCPRPVGLIETATIIVCDQQPPVSCARGLLRPQLDAGGHLYKKLVLRQSFFDIHRRLL